LPHAQQVHGEHRPHRVDDAVDRADLVEVDLVQARAVRVRLGRCQVPEHGDALLLGPEGQPAVVDELLDVRQVALRFAAVAVAMAVAVLVRVFVRVFVRVIMFKVVMVVMVMSMIMIVVVLMSMIVVVVMSMIVIVLMSMVMVVVVVMLMSMIVSVLMVMLVLMSMIVIVIVVMSMVVVVVVVVVVRRGQRLRRPGLSVLVDRTNVRLGARDLPGAPPHAADRQVPLAPDALDGLQPSLDVLERNTLPHHIPVSQPDTHPTSLANIRTHRVQQRAKQHVARNARGRVDEQHGGRRHVVAAAAAAAAKATERVLGGLQEQK